MAATVHPFIHAPSVDKSLVTDDLVVYASLQVALKPPFDDVLCHAEQLRCFVDVDPLEKLSPIQ